MNIPHEAIRRDEDRAWTGRLLDALVRAETDETEREEIARTLEALDDPRAYEPLAGILEDRRLPEDVRDAAGALVRSSWRTLAGERLRALWAEGDLVVRRHALLAMGRAEADLVEPVASSPAHPLYEEAILTMEFGFQEPRFQALKIAALAHAEPSVREAAALTLRWDEPVAAEAALLRATGDSVPAVAVEALRTLAYYPGRHVLAHVVALGSHPDAAVREAAGEAADALRDALFTRSLAGAGPAERRYLLAWAEPVRHLDVRTDGETSAAEASARSSPSSPRGPSELASAEPEPLGADELIATFADADGAWAEKKRRFPRRGEAAGLASERGRLVPFLAAHADPWVRESATTLFAGWGEHGALLELTRDRDFGVRKAAMYALGLAVAHPGVAGPVWAHLLRPGTTSTHAYETLDAYVRHAPRDESLPRLLALARDDARESVRVRAIDLVARFGGAALVRQLVPLLAGAPQVTWAVHIATLDACWKPGVDPGDLDALRDVDNVDVQAALAPHLGGGLRLLR